MDTKRVLTNSEYNVLSDLYHNFHEAYLQLPDYIKDLFLERLYKKY